MVIKILFNPCLPPKVSWKQKKRENLTFRDRRFPVQRQGFDLRIWHRKSQKKRRVFFHLPTFTTASQDFWGGGIKWFTLKQTGETLFCILPEMNPCAACCIASHIEKLIGQAFPRQALPSVAWMLKLFWVPYFQSHSAAEFSAANTTQRQITISPAFDHYFSEISHFHRNLCPHLHKDIAPGNPFLPFPPGHPGNMWPFRQLRDTDIEQTLISSLVCTVTGLGCESFAEGASLCKGPILFETKSAFGRSWMLPNHVPCFCLFGIQFFKDKILLDFFWGGWTG